MGITVSILLHLSSGTLGGLVAGIVRPNISLGILGDIIAGLTGGVGLGLLLNALGLCLLMEDASSFPCILANFVAGTIGGIAVMTIVAVIKKLFAK